MRTTLMAFALVGLLMTTAAGRADDATKEKEKEKKTLKPGDAAPALKATKWMQGEEVKSFEAGKIYVVEFWATWCGPCIVMMPHLSELQAEYKSKGVTVIGFSGKDPNNTEEKVAEFVKKRGPKLKYTFAYADNRDTNEAWMTASGQRGIPCSFVVDKAGKVAWIGHPMYLDVVLPKVVDGTWKAEKGKEEMAVVEKDVNAAFAALRGADAEESLKKIQDFDNKYPGLSKIPYFVAPKMMLLVKNKKVKEAKKMAEDVMARAMTQEDASALRSVSMAMRSGEAKDEKELTAVALKAAEAMVEIAGDKDALALFNLAETQFAIGDKEKARETGKKAVEAADGPIKRFLEQRVKTFEEKKEEKKDEK